MTVDTLHTVEVPEGALLQITVAGPVIRGLAWLIDVAIRLLILLALATLLSLTTVSDQSEYSLFGLFLIVQFVINWFYTTLFEAISGATPGKKYFALCVVHDNATPITWSGAIIRNFLRVVDFLPFFYITGLSAMLIDNRFRRLGDLAAGTLVVYKDKPPVAASFEYDLGVPPPEWLSRTERQAVVDFAERCPSLSTERQQELASVLSHLIDDESNPVHTLKCWAHWILRGQANAEPASV